MRTTATTAAVRALRALRQARPLTIRHGPAAALAGFILGGAAGKLSQPLADALYVTAYIGLLALIVFKAWEIARR